MNTPEHAAHDRNRPFDVRGAAFKLLDTVCVQFDAAFWTATMRASCLLRGVELGEGCRFWGRTYFRRHYASPIQLGDRCRLRSSRRSNLAGINRPCILSTHSRGALIRVGEAAGFSGTVIGAQESITIGEGTLCGVNTFITDFDWHNRSNHGAAPVNIGRNVWLSANVVVLKGVTIGDHTVVAANSVVTRSLPGGVLAGGAPCRAIRELDRL